jgi:aspartate/methionine/tyrosine aminotransferase
MSELNFGWGEPYCVRECLEHYYKKKNYMVLIDIKNAGYSNAEGNLQLINSIKKIIKYTTGIEYKYILITHGTTGAINVVLRSLAKEGKNICYTHEYYFPYYPFIIEKNNYEHKKGLGIYHEKNLSKKNTVGLVDSPSNPDGNLFLYTDNLNNIIWDSVYHNQVFINTIPILPDHRVNCGSLSKLLGLTGLRVGWIATNNEEDFKKFTEENLYENCTMSFYSQQLAVDIIESVDFDNFTRSAKYRINNNRELFDRVKHLFDNQEVPENGMFYPAWTSPYTCQLLDKLGISYVKLDESGKDKLLRFNLAQLNEITQKAIRFLRKEDLTHESI